MFQGTAHRDSREGKWQDVPKAGFFQAELQLTAGSQLGHSSELSLSVPGEVFWVSSEGRGRGIWNRFIRKQMQGGQHPGAQIECE